MTTKPILGIGNPDPEYQNTRHNVGFMFLDFLVKKLEANDFELDKELDSLISKTKLGKTSVVLAKPRTYVNKSGEAAKKLIEKLKVKTASIVVIQDDLDVPFGNTKISFDKNSGGHKGVESIMRALKTKKFYRLRIGLGTNSLQKARQQPAKKRDEFVRNYVLSKFSKNESDKLKSVFKEAYEKLLNLNF